MLIRIKQLEAYTIIGVNDWEKEKPQKILLTLEMGLLHHKSAKSDAIEDTVDYYDVSVKLRKFLAEELTELIERLVDKIATKLFADYHLIQHVMVEIDKLGVIENAKSVSVSNHFTREKDA